MTYDAKKEEIGELRLIGKKVVKFQNFLMKRAFGLFYGIWAIDLLIILMSQQFLSPFYSSLLSYAGIIAGLFVSQNVFRRSMRTTRYKYRIERQQNSIKVKFPSLIIRLLVTLAAVEIILDLLDFEGIIITSAYLSFLLFFTIVFAAGLASFFMSYSSLGKITAENVIFSGSLFLSGILEFVLDSSRTLSAIYGSMITVIWSLAIASWIISSIISLYNSAEDLVVIDA
jgi:hypothetical protein